VGLVKEEPLPPWLDRLAEQLVAANVFDAAHKPNHALINEYLPGQGILAHTDGSAYFPTVATLSLGSDALMHYRRCGASTKLEAEVVLARNSIVITRGEAYSDYMHSIDPVESEVIGERCSEVVNLGESGESGDAGASDAAASASAGSATSRFKRGDTIVRTTRVSITIRHVPAVAPECK
jgi:alkylated DNA repair protein alkB family protein 6